MVNFMPNLATATTKSDVKEALQLALSWVEQECCDQQLAILLRRALLRLEM
jgi:hypothetical protein